MPDRPQGIERVDEYLERAAPAARRGLGSPRLFAIVYTSVASAIYFSLGVVATRALGLTQDLLVDEVEEPARPGDRFLLCSDGVNSMLTDDQIAEQLRADSPEEAAWGLVEAANAAGGNDNISAVVVDVVE